MHMFRSVVSHRSMRMAALFCLLFSASILLCLVFADSASPAVSEGTWQETLNGFTIVGVALVAAMIASLMTRHRLLRKRRYATSRSEQIPLLDAIFYQAPIAIGIVKGEILVELNQELCTLTGFARDELLKKPYRKLFANSDEGVANELSNTDSFAMLSNGTCECVWQCKDGRRLNVLLSAREYGEESSSGATSFFVHDVTSAKTVEQQLRANEAYYHTMIDLAVDGILIGDQEGQIIEANHRICTMLLMEREALVGKHITRIPFAAQSLKENPFRFDLVQQGKTILSERAFERPDGSVIFLEMRSKMMPDGTYQSICRDITLRKQTEQALRESDEKFTLAFAASPDSININRMEDGMYVAINQGFSDLTGYSWDTVQGKTSAELNIWHDPADRERLLAELQTKGYCNNLEAIFRKKDGSLGTGLLSARPIQLNNVPHILSITRDITEKKQAAADLERLKVAIEQVAEMVVITDAQGRIHYANPAFTETAGYSFDEVYLRNPRMLKSGKHDATFYAALWKTIASGRTWSGKMVNRKKNGELYTIESTISPVFDQHGAIVNYVAIKRDITDQLRLEAQYHQAQKMESIGRLTGGVAHDFNNMLAVIIGYAEMALVKISAEHSGYADIERILEAAHRSADIVQQLLAFARKQAITPKVIQLNHLVDGILNMLRRLIGEAIDLRWNPGTELPLIRIDPVQVDQVLANLCINARDAIHGNGTIELRTSFVVLQEDFCRKHPGAQPGPHVVLQVIDNGCGIKQDQLDKIFDPFFTTKGQQGTGLGLATVYGIVIENNGIVTVDSLPGSGATFSVYLPAHDQGYALDGSVQNCEQPLLGTGEIILLVEDDPGILELCRSMLTSLGYTVSTASSPSQALEEAMLHQEDIDLLLTDVIMPEMNGTQLAQEIVKICPVARLLFMSGYTDDILGQHGVPYEEIHFLQKPFDLKTLSEKVREVLDAPVDAR